MKFYKDKILPSETCEACNGDISGPGTERVVMIYSVQAAYCKKCGEVLKKTIEEQEFHYKSGNLFDLHDLSDEEVFDIYFNCEVELNRRRIKTS